MDWIIELEKSDKSIRMLLTELFEIFPALQKVGNVAWIATEEQIAMQWVCDLVKWCMQHQLDGTYGHSSNGEFVAGFSVTEKLAVNVTFINRTYHVSVLTRETRAQKPKKYESWAKRGWKVDLYSSNE